MSLPGFTLIMNVHHNTYYSMKSLKNKLQTVKNKFTLVLRCCIGSSLSGKVNWLFVQLRAESYLQTFVLIVFEYPRLLSSRLQVNLMGVALGNQWRWLYLMKNKHDKKYTFSLTKSMDQNTSRCKDSHNYRFFSSCL